jgi:hypothetical protein
MLPGFSVGATDIQDNASQALACAPEAALFTKEREPLRM